MISIAIVTIILGSGTTVGLGAYRTHVFQGERAIVVSLLERARSQSMHGIDGSSHGLCHDPVSGTYILFTGRSCMPGTSTNLETMADPGVLVDGLSSGVVFTRLSGTTTPAIIRLSLSGHTADIIIDYEGLITW